MLLKTILNSLKAKVAAVFVIFGILFVVEGAMVVVFWNKAGAVSKQIEIALEAAQINQQAHNGFRESVVLGQAQPTDLIGRFESVNDLLIVLQQGGRAGNSDLILPAASGMSILSLEKLVDLHQKQKAAWTTLLAQQAINDSLASSHLLANLIEADGLAKTVNSSFQQLIVDLRSEEKSRQGQLVWLIVIIVLIDMGVLVYFFQLMSQKIFKPVNEIADAAHQQRLSRTQSTDELGVVATNLNAIIQQLKEATDFINAIGEGNLDAKLVGENESNSLSNALLAMQQKLKFINEEDRKRKWSTEGLAKFVEILRSGESNLSALGDNIIKALVNYLGASQGGLYVWNDDQPENPYIELISSYAFNRKKYEVKKIMAGEGLLGQAYLEQATTYLTEIPPDYFKIVSGLGETAPQAILIVPFLSDSKVYGLVELASFKKFEPYEITFVEKLGEAVASTLASVKTNEKNKKLLQDFQEQTESLRSQEEEMRQNMEELTATQEEMSRKEHDYIKQIDELQKKLREASADGQWEIARQASEALQANLRALDLSLQAVKSPN